MILHEMLPQVTFLSQIKICFIYLLLLVVTLPPDPQGCAYCPRQFGHSVILSLPNSEFLNVYFGGMRSGHCWLGGLMDSLEIYRTEE